MVNSVTFHGDNVVLTYTQMLKPHFPSSFSLLCFSSVDIQHLVLRQE